MKAFFKQHSSTILSLIVTAGCTLFVLKVNAMIEEKMANAVTTTQFQDYVASREKFGNEVIKRLDSDHTSDQQQITGLREDLRNLGSEVRTLTLELSKRPIPPRFNQPEP